MNNSTSLKDRVSTLNTNWPELIFLAEAEQEWFEEVTIITLKTHYQTLVYDQAWEQAESLEGLNSRARDIMNSKSIQVQEYIKTNDDSSVEVCIDHEVITDQVVDEVLDLLAEVGITPNTHLNFGESKTFTAGEFGILPK